MVSGLFTLHTIREVGKDVGSIRTGDPRTPTRILDINPVSGPPGHIHLYAGTSGQRLAAWLGAWVHGGNPGILTLRCMLKPDYEFVHLSVGTSEQTCMWVYVNVREQQGSSPWFQRDAASKLFIWLTEWLMVEHDPIYRKPIGAYSSEEEYQEYERPRYREPDPSSMDDLDE